MSAENKIGFGGSSDANTETNRISYDRLGYILLQVFEGSNKPIDVETIILAFMGEDFSLSLPSDREKRAIALKPAVEKINKALDAFDIKLEVYIDGWDKKLFVKKKN